MLATKTTAKGFQNRNYEGPVRYGQEPEDVHQEWDLGIVMGGGTHPRDPRAYQRGIVRVARFKQKERRWQAFRAPLADIGDEESPGFRAVTRGTQFEQAVVNEILERLTKRNREIVIEAMTTGCQKRLKKAARLVREALPEMVA